jgi:xanthine dehydrogenase accessory factor
LRGVTRHPHPYRAQPLTGSELAVASEQLIARGVPFVEATVVRAQRPASVRAGDAAVVHPDGTIEGFVGGDCAESSVRLHALRVLETGEPLLLRIVPGEVEGEQASDEGAVMVKNPCLSGGGLEVFLKPRLPAATLRVIGQTPIALALADLGARLGFAVELDAPGESEPHGDDAAVVVASHGRDEEPVLAAALRSGVPYVGLVASEVRGDAVRRSLDLSEELRAQLHTPAGLEIGAQTPEEIALAILAEIVALRRSREAPGRGRPFSRPATAPPEESSAEADTPIAAAPPTRAEVAVDPVCGMEVAISEASVQLDRDGERHYFCSEGCRDRFAAQGAPGSRVR